jgi:glycosyltransferase involved in cell wall biosynthesis
MLRRAASVMYRGALTGADGLFVQNPDDERDLRASGALPRALPVTLIRGSGVDIDHYQPVPLPPPPPVFLYIGRLVREKGFGEFVEMARRVRAAHPEIRFRAVGWIDPNPASVGHAELEAWVNTGVIEYGGEVPDVRPELAAAHVLVLPSYREGTPRSVLEAMSMGRPVITTDVPGCRETIVDGEHGMLVPARDPAALAAAAEQLIRDPARIAVMGTRARARIEQLYDARVVATQMLDVMGL